MRKFYMMLFVALFLTVTMWGRQRAINEAESIAQTALRNTAASKGRSIKSGSVSMRTIRSSQILKRQKVTQEHEAFFLCKHEGEGAGFVVVSADDRMPEVLAVSDDGSFDENNVPENMQVMLQDYAEALEQIERIIRENLTTPNVPLDHLLTHHLLQDVWLSPWLRRCAIINGLRIMEQAVLVILQKSIRIQWP